MSAMDQPRATPGTLSLAVGVAPADCSSTPSSSLETPAHTGEAKSYLAPSDESSTPSSSLEKPAHTGEAKADSSQMPPIASLLLMFYFNALAVINMVIVIPTGNEYAHLMGAGDAFYGLSIGAVPLAGLLGILLNQWLLKRGHLSLKSMLLAFPTVSIFANTIYALAGLVGSGYVLLSARCLIGIFNGFNLTPMYISLAVGSQRRSEMSFYYSAVSTLSFAAAPALAAALEVLMHFSPGSLAPDAHNQVWNSYTAPGWFMAVVYGLFVVQVILFFEDLPLEVTATLPKKNTQSPPCRLPIVLSCAVFWYFCTAGLVMAVAEVYVVNAGENSLDLSIADSALLIALLMLCSGLANLLIGRFAAPYLQSDRAGILTASFLACLACIPFFNFGLEALSGFTIFACVGVGMVLTLAGVIRACALSVSSKLVLPHVKTLMVTIAMVAQTIGRGFGAIVGAVVDQDAFAALMIGVFIATLLMSVSSYPYMRYEAEVNQ